MNYSVIDKHKRTIAEIAMEVTVDEPILNATSTKGKQPRVTVTHNFQTDGEPQPYWTPVMCVDIDFKEASVV